MKQMKSIDWSMEDSMYGESSFKNFFWERCLRKSLAEGCQVSAGTTCSAIGMMKQEKHQARSIIIMHQTKHGP